MAADGKFYRYSVKECYVYPMTADSSASTTGPTYGTGKQVIGIQTISWNVAGSPEQLPGDDVILGVESSDEAVEISCEYGKMHHEALAALKGTTAIIDGGVSTYYHHTVDGTVYVKLVCRCAKIGKSGADQVVTFYKVNVNSMEFSSENKAFGKNSFSAQAIPTDSTIDVGGTDRNITFTDAERETAASIAAAVDTTAPTVSSTNPTDGATGQATSVAVVWTFSEALDPNHVTPDNVFLMKQDGTAVTCDTPVLVNNGASTTITLTPSSPLTGTTDYVGVCTTNIRDSAGNKLAAKSVVNFQTT